MFLHCLMLIQCLVLPNLAFLDDYNEQEFAYASNKVLNVSLEKLEKSLLTKLEELNQKILVLEQKNDNLTAQLQEKQTQETKLTTARTVVANPRTCHDIRSADPSAQSGTYFIDPDGLGTGDDPVQVFCNMTTGTTEVLHDSEADIQVSSCSSAGCYSRTIKYEATARQIEALISLSSSCKQHVQYDCVNAPLHYDGVAYAWWNDRNGSAKYHWSGSSNVGSLHTCQCGIENRCADRSRKCNCDSAAATPQNDQGYITDMAALPVTKLNFGRTSSSSSKGVHRLGRLECSGRTLPTGEPRSCEDLWKSGHVLPAIFSVKDQGKLKAVYCDFSKLPTEQGYQKDIGIFDVKSSSVYFHMYVRSTGIGKSIVPTSGVHVNVGGAVNSKGVFKAPVAGTYHFQFFARKGSGTNEAFVTLMKGSTILSSTRTHSSALATSATLDLDAGETVSVALNGGDLYNCDWYKYNVFSGMLLQQRDLP